MMPSAAPTRDKSDVKWQALKRYIIKDRQRQKQEQEADAEEQRQKREREQKQKQDVMTLGETNEQLSELQSRLATLTEAKHQLFLSLKKVLNEDDNRRKQAFRDSSELLGAGAGYMGAGGTGRLYLQPMQTVVPCSPVQYRKAVAAVSQQQAVCAGTSSGKRPRSPSPPTSQSHNYHPYTSYKSPPFPQHKQEDGRRNHEYVRAVLWNKGTAAAAATYGGVYGSVYGVAPTQPVYSYASAPAGYEQVYLPRQPYDGKADGEKVYLRGPTGPLPMPVHPAQASKAGGITTGFPVRASHQAHSVYLPGGSSGRLMYGAAPTSVPTAAPRYQSSV